MKYALICPNEPMNGGYRIAQVESEIFPVGDPTYWLECSDEVVADVWYFDQSRNIPAPITQAPFTSGVQSV